MHVTLREDSSDGRHPHLSCLVHQQRIPIPTAQLRWQARLKTTQRTAAQLLICHSFLFPNVMPVQGKRKCCGHCTKVLSRRPPASPQPAFVRQPPLPKRRYRRRPHTASHGVARIDGIRRYSPGHDAATRTCDSAHQRRCARVCGRRRGIE